ncbi:oligosaccharide flippase family protein [Salimicrobium flavidum]|uniref:Membrane protein involved in the export of O-antigen and teichoic acid n=1 Tax=Salimicrobium flavidum TaxID=570947 RepID=A0A1N7KN30_9BACI|nr:oligosaccharide flippase family protein [Salimicrobium flavidum]SIS62978.1 Membrane protein involved in the export of O-antigen and teichoic acid [Salimicrobium flavidum]
MNGIRKNSIALNIVHLFYSTALSSAINAVALILLAGYLQSHDYGMFSVALAFAMIMSYFTDAGLSDIVLREGAKQDVSLSGLMSSYIKMRVFLLLLTFVFGFIIIYFMNNDNKELLRIAYTLIIPMVTGVALQSIGTTFFKLIEKMQYFGLIRLVSAIILVTSLGIGMLLQAHPLIMASIYGSSYMLAGVFGVFLVKKYVSLNLRQTFHKGILRNLGAFTIGGLLFVLLPHIGPIILEKTITLREVGLFAVAYRIPQALQQIPFVVAGAYYPVLFKHFHNQRMGEHYENHLTQIKLMALVGMMMTIPIFYLSEFIISLLFGPEWMDSALPLKILAMMLLFQSVNIAFADGLTTVEKQNTRTMVQLVAVLAGVLFYIFLSRSYGVVGAAVAGMLVELVALIGFWAFTPTRWKLMKQVVLPYFTFFLISLGLVEGMLGDQNWFKVIIHFSLVLIFCVMDEGLRSKVVEFIADKRKVWSSDEQAEQRRGS